MKGSSESTSVGDSNTTSLLDKTMSLFLTRSYDGAFSDEVAYYTTLVNVVCICTVLSSFGVFANVTNLIILKRQGFRDTVNITLFSTAISDLFSLVTTLWLAICYNPLFISSDIPFLPLEIELLSGQMPHVVALNATAWLTAFVTFERCLCIAFPLKVKDMITTTRAKAVVATIFVMVIALQIPTYWVNRPDWKFDLERNRTVLGVIFLEEYALLDAITIYLVNCLGLFVSFMIVLICSVVLVVKLSQKSKWRMTAASMTGKEQTILTRDRKVMKMILAVAVMFIATNTPGIIVFLYTATDQEFVPTGSLANNYFVGVSFALVFESINASANILIYYNMSSKYRAIFRSFFCRESVKP